MIIVTNTLLTLNYLNLDTTCIMNVQFQKISAEEAKKILEKPTCVLLSDVEIGNISVFTGIDLPDNTGIDLSDNATEKPLLLGLNPGDCVLVFQFKRVRKPVTPGPTITSNYEITKLTIS